MKTVDDYTDLKSPNIGSAYENEVFVGLLALHLGEIDAMLLPYSIIRDLELSSSQIAIE